MQFQRARRAAAQFAPAIGLTLAFYLLVLLSCAALIGIPIAIAANTGIPIGWMIWPGLITAWMLLAAVFPRRDDRDLPYVRVSAADQPDLAALLAEVSEAMGLRRVPDLHVADVANAYAFTTGDRLGLGGRQGVAVGLPLMQALSADELRSVIAHEIGHHLGDDTRTGTWFAAMHGHMRRTLEALARRESFLEIPFAIYYDLFVRVTHAAKRRQEQAADARERAYVGDELAGRSMLASHAAGTAFAAYWRMVAPLLAAGRRPPVLAGFAEYLRAPGIVRWINDSLAFDLAFEKADDPHATHPALGERIAGDTAVTWSPPERAAIELVRDPEALELPALLAGAPEDVELEPIAWEDAVTEVWLPSWRRQGARLVRRCGRVTAAEIPALVERLREEDPAAAVDLVGAAFAAALAREGWTLEVPLGSPVVAQRGRAHVEPFHWVRGLVREEVSAQQFGEMVHALELEELALSTPAPRGQTVGETEIPLTKQGGGIVAAVGLGLIFGLIGLPVAIGCAVVSVLPGDHLALAARLVIGGIGWGLLAGIVAYAYLVQRQIRTVPILRVTADRLTIEDRSRFRAPIEIPRDAVRVAAVEVEPYDDGYAFPIVTRDAWSGVETDGCLWREGFGGPLPEIGTADRRPNIALVFSAPIAQPGPNLPLGGLARRSALPGALLGAEDPAAAEQALAGWGVVRELEPEDGEALTRALAGQAEPVAA
jgi:Zn-dependent protease with chaperone function